MLEPFAATVFTSILPTRPLATQLLNSKSAFGMAVRTATHSLPPDFFTPYVWGKGKEKALPEDDYVACSGVLVSGHVKGCDSIVGGAPASMMRLPSARPRTRRSSGHKHTALGGRSHIPSLRTWLRQVDVVQRRYASSRAATAVEPAQRPGSSTDDEDLKEFRVIVEGSRQYSADDTWQAFHRLCDIHGQAPESVSTSLAFVANFTMFVADGRREDLSRDFLRLWGERIQDMLHHVDPGIQDMPQNLDRVRWNYLFIAASAMQGRLDEAAAGARALFRERDEAHKDLQRAQLLDVYIVLLRALRCYRGTAAVYDFLIEESDLLHKYLADFPSVSWGNDDLAEACTRFSAAALDIVCDLGNPLQCFEARIPLWSKYKLSAAGCYLLRALSRPEHAKDAHAILQRLRRDSIVVPKDVVLAVVRNMTKADLYHDAQKHFASISPPRLSEVSRNFYIDYHSTGLLLQSRQKDTDSAERHFRKLVECKSLNPAAKAAIMHVYATAGQVGRVVEMFNEFFPNVFNLLRQYRPNTVHYTTVIYAHAQAGDLDGVNLWLRKLAKARRRPDLHVYSVILQSFAERGDVTSMSTLLDQMRDEGISMNAVIYTTVITTLARRKDPLGAERLYKRALTEGIVPDRVMVSAIMNAHVEAGSWQGAIRTFDYLNTPERAGAGLTIEVFNTLMKAYVLIGAPFRVVANLFRQLDRAELRPDARTFALLIQSACDSGFMDIAEELYQEMERITRDGAQPSLEANVYVLTIMMSGYLRRTKRVKAKVVFDRMTALDIKPNAVTYAAILKAYGEQKTSQGTKVAEEFLQSLMNRENEAEWLQVAGGRRLTLETVYRPLLNAFNKREEPAKVERLYRSMLDAGGRPTLGTATILLDVYRRTGDIAAVQEIWPEVRRLGLDFVRENILLSPVDEQSPSLRAYGTLMCVPLSIYIDALSAAGKHAEVARAWKAFKDEGLQFDSHNWNHLVAALVRAGEPQRAFDVVENVILRYQHQSRKQLERDRDAHPRSPLMLDLPPPDEGDLPSAPPEAALHVPHRRSRAVKRATKHLRKRESLEERGAEDFPHPLHVLHALSPVWNIWRPHGATLVLLGRVLDHLRSGRLVQPLQPNVDSDFEGAAVDAEEIVWRTEAAGQVLGEIRERFPQTLRLVEEYALMRRAGRRGS